MKSAFQITIKSSNSTQTLILDVGHNHITLMENSVIDIYQNGSPATILNVMNQNEQLTIQIDHETALIIDNHNSYPDTKIIYLSESGDIVALNLAEATPVLAQEVATSHSIGVLPYILGGAAIVGGAVALSSKGSKGNANIANEKTHNSESIVSTLPPSDNSPSNDNTIVSPINPPSNNSPSPILPPSTPTSTSLLNKAPTDIILSSKDIPENQAGAIVGTISVIDSDDTEFTYVLSDERFEIVGGNLKLKKDIFITHNNIENINLNIIAKDKSENSVSRSFTLNVLQDNNDKEENKIDNNDNVFIAPSDSNENYTIDGLGGDDEITTANGIDIIRGGAGKDIIHSGKANDAIVIVGVTKDIEYSNHDITNASSSGYDLSGVISEKELSEKTVSDISDGEIYDGQDGNNTLITYGYTDLTKVSLKNFLFIRAEEGTIKITAEQLNELKLKVISSDNSNLIITSTNKPSIVDFSKTNVHLFKSITIEEGVTLIVNERSLYQTDYLAGKGVLRIVSNQDDGIPDLSGKIISVLIQDENGNDITEEQHKGKVVIGNLIIGTADSEELTGTDYDDRIMGREGNDTIIGGKGNDIIRGGKGSNILDGGEGDDKFIVIGNLLAGGKINNDTDENVLGFPIETLNGKNWKESISKQIIHGGEGNDILYVIGTADISDYELDSIEIIEIRSDVTASHQQLLNREVNGDGSSIIRIKNNANLEDISSSIVNLKLSNIRQIHLDKGVVLEVSNPSELGGALILSGEGTIRFTEPVSKLGSEFSITNTIHIEDINGDVNLDDVRKLNMIEYASDHIQTQHSVDKLIEKDSYFKDKQIKFNLEGTDGNDYIEGSQYNDFIDGKEGDDILSGKDGSDIFSISNTLPAKKTIVDKSQVDDPQAKDTLYLANAKGAANIDLGKFTGTIGGTKNEAGIIENPLTYVEIGNANTGSLTKAISSKTNVLLIIDRSGSMDGERMIQAKKAAIQLLDKYDNQGDVAVRVLAFNNNTYQSFNNYDGWLDKEDAIKAINSIYADGGTDYYAALNGAEDIFTKNQSNIYHKNGVNMSFFLSDGEPNSPISSDRQAQWEEFTKEHKILSQAIGFGGLRSKAALEAIAYDGKNAQDIEPILESDLDKLDETVTELAKTDFIENIVGTDFDDYIVGNNLNNHLYGGKGDDILDGSGGNNYISGGEGQDTAKFSEDFESYLITYTSDRAMIKHLSSGNTTTIDRTVEKLQFADQEVSVQFPEEKGIEDAFPSLLMAKFANAAYINLSGINSRKELENSGWRFLNSEDLGIDDKYFGGKDITDNKFKITPYFENGGHSLLDEKSVNTDLDNNGVVGGKVIYPNHSFGDVDRTEQINGSSAAILAKKGDTLVLSFRGTEDVTLRDNNLPNKKFLTEYVPIVKAISSLVFKAKGIELSKQRLNIPDEEYNKTLLETWELIKSLPILGDTIKIGDLFVSNYLNKKYPILGNAIKSIAELMIGSLVNHFIKDILKSDHYDDYLITDSSGWINQIEHYNNFKPLLESLESYIHNNNITKLFVTGHSLGGGMANWFMADKINGAESEAYRDIKITALPFAAPSITDTQRYPVSSDENIIRLEASRDLVPDTTDLLLNALKKLYDSNNPLKNIQVSNNGLQYNFISHKGYYGESVGFYHSMSQNYLGAVKDMETTGFNEDLNFIRHSTKAIHPTNSDPFTPVVLDEMETRIKYQNHQLSSQKTKTVVDVTGDKGNSLREFIVAEQYLEDDIIIGTAGNDKLVGDADSRITLIPEVGWKGTNDIFYIGQGKDTVYGDQTGGLFSGKSDDDGGIDTVVYRFADTKIAKGQLNDVTIRGHLAHKDGNQIFVNIDGSEDTLYDIEYLHFIDKPSEETNLLAGSDGHDVIKGLGGDDFLFGADGHDQFIENRNSGNDRIHGGKGYDSVFYDGVNIKSVDGKSITIKDRTLVVQLDDGSVDHLYSIEGISTNAVSKTTQSWLNEYLNLDDDQKLLALYQPIFKYKDGDADDLKVFGQVVRDSNNKIVGLDYELREKDLLDPDDSWWVRIALGDDLLPTYYYTEDSAHNNPDHKVQIRNVFDSSLTFAGDDNNHIEIYLDIDRGGAYLIKPKSFKDSDMRTFGNYSVELTGMKQNIWDFGDHAELNTKSKSSDYEESIEPKLAGLPSGQMEMGFLFQNTTAMKLGHFDLLGEPMNHSGIL